MTHRAYDAKVVSSFLSFGASWRIRELRLTVDYFTEAFERALADFVTRNNHVQTLFIWVEEQKRTAVEGEEYDADSDDDGDYYCPCPPWWQW